MVKIFILISLFLRKETIIKRRNNYHLYINKVVPDKIDESCYGASISA